MLAVQHRKPSERFDPPCLRHTWLVDETQPRDAFLDDARARLLDAGWDVARIASMLHHGGLHVGGRPCARDTLPAAIDAGARIVAYAFAWEPEPLTLSDADVLLDDAGVVAVNKPAWIAVQATRASRMLSLERALRERLACPGLVAVHRLDRETSGVLLFARDASAASRLGRALAAGAVRKRYVAVVSPVPTRVAWTTAGFVGRALHPSRFRFAHHGGPGPGRRPSETRFRLLRVRGERALVEAEPITGRTHQIRVHLAADGTPIEGDPLYGPAPGSAEEVATDAFVRRGADRTQLHAESIVIPGADGSPREIEAPWPDDFGRGFES